MKNMFRSNPESSELFAFLPRRVVSAFNFTADDILIYASILAFCVAIGFSYSQVLSSKSTDRLTCHIDNSMIASREVPECDDAANG